MVRETVREERCIRVEVKRIAVRYPMRVILWLTCPEVEVRKFVKVRVSIDPVREGPVVRQGGRQTGESVDCTRTMAVMAAGEFNDGAESRCSPVARMFHGHELVS